MLKGNQSYHDNDDIGLIPVKSRHKTNNRTCTADDSVQCRNCLGLYLRNKLCDHLKYKCLVFNSKKGSPLKSPRKPKVDSLRQHSLSGNLRTGSGFGIVMDCYIELLVSYYVNHNDCMFEQRQLLALVLLC